MPGGALAAAAVGAGTVDAASGVIDDAGAKNWDASDDASTFAMLRSGIGTSATTRIEYHA